MNELKQDGINIIIEHTDREKKVQEHINFLLNNPDVVLLRELKNYGQKIEDKNFFLQVLTKKPNSYEFINNQYKTDPEIIELALKDYKNFFYLPENEQKNRFELWYEKNKKKIESFAVLKLDVDYQKIIFNDNPLLLTQLLKTHSEKVLPFVKEVLQNNPYPFIENLNTDTIKILDINNIKDELTHLLEGYIFVYYENRKYADSLSYLLRYDKDLTEKLEKNPSYRISVAVKKNRNISVELFEQYLEQMLEKYNSIQDCHRSKINSNIYQYHIHHQNLTEEKIGYSLEGARKQLNKQKQQLYPDNLLVYLKSRSLAENLENNLDKNTLLHTKKRKI